MESTVTNKIRILQFSDLHLFEDNQRKLLNFNPYIALQEVLQDIKKNIKLHGSDLVLLTGDLSQDYSTVSYQKAYALCNDFFSEVGVCLGNHDDVGVFTKIFGKNHTEKKFVFPHWVVVLLNSNKFKSVFGYLQPEELIFLEQVLLQYPEKSIIIFLHHQVLPVGSAWLDNIGLQNTAELLDIIDRYPNVRIVACGHVHQESFQRRNNVDFVSAPATSWQFAKFSPDFKLDSAMPGYRWIELYADGAYRTDVVRVPFQEGFLPDFNSSGY